MCCARVLLVLTLIVPCGYAQTISNFFGETNGAVYAIHSDETYVYVGGEFSRVASASQKAGGSAALDITTGESLQFPSVDGKIYSVVQDGSGGWVLGGDFTIIGTHATRNLAHINSDLSVDPSWTFQMNGPVRCMATNGSQIIVGGEFTSVNGNIRNRLALISSNGTVDVQWNPSVNNSVFSLAIKGNDLFVGGFFSEVSNQARMNLAKVSLQNQGALDPSWNPSPNGMVSTILSTGNDLYIGGLFTSIGTTARNYAALISANAEGLVDPTWNPSPNGNVYSIAWKGNDIFLAGSFTQVNGNNMKYLAKVGKNGVGAADATWNISPNAEVHTLYIQGNELLLGGYFTTINLTDRKYIAKINLTDPAISSWNPGTNGAVFTLLTQGTKLVIGGDFTFSGGSIRNNIARYLKSTGELDNNFSPATDGRVLSLLTTGGYLIIAGAFANVNGLTRNRIAKINTTTGVLENWDPNVNGYVQTLLVDQQQVYMGGNFTAVGTTNRSNLARVSLSGTGDPDITWNPAPNGAVNCLSANQGYIFVGGDFTSIGGQSKKYLARVNTSGWVDTAWDIKSDNSVFATLIIGNDLYLGGSFSQINNMARDKLARVNATTVAVDLTWNPMPNGSVTTLAAAGSGVLAAGLFNRIGGQERNGLAKIESTGQVSANWIPQPNTNTVYELHVIGNQVIAGGAFTSISQKMIRNLATLVSSPVLQVSKESTVLSTGSTVAFDQIKVFEKKEIQLSLKNTGDDELSISALNLSGNQFYLDPLALPVWIAPGQTVSVKFFFSPTTTGDLSEVLTITSTSSTNPSFTLNFTGKANKLKQAITFGPLPEKILGSTPFQLMATSTSGLTITYASSNESIASVDGNQVTIKSAGEVTLTATQQGNDIYNAATPVVQNLKINLTKINQTINFAELPTKTLEDDPFKLTAIASSNLPITYSSSDESIASVTGDQVTIKNSGEVTITAAQSGNDAYYAAVSVSRKLKINPPKLNQVITFDALPVKSINDPPFKLTATTTSNLIISYTSSDELIASISGDQVTIKKSGEVTITASQAGNEIYKAANAVSQTLKISPVTLVTAVEPMLQVLFYPNPVDHMLTIKFENNNKHSIKLFDTTGRDWIDLIVNTEQAVIDLTELNSGIYILQIVESSGRALKHRLIKR